MRFAIENSALPLLYAPVIYRAARSGWWFVAFNLVSIAAVFIFVCLPWLNLGELSAEEISGKQRIVSNAPMIWGAFLLGAVFLTLLPLQVCELLVYRVVADQNGLRWRRFVEWKSARWSEVTDCVLPPPGTIQAAYIEMGDQKIAFDVNNLAWPALRDFVAARVVLPDNLEAWRVTPTTTDAERRALHAEAGADESAPVVQHSDAGLFAVFGVMLCAVPITAMFSPRANYLAGAIVLALGFAGGICWPVFYARRTFVRCDDDGLTLGTLAGRRRIAWGEIDDLFELTSLHKSSSIGRPHIVVSGETIALEARGKKRWALLNRIEARAFNSRSRRFETREWAPVGSDLPLPATLSYRDAWRDWHRSIALVGGVIVAAVAVVGAAIRGLGWENFENSRGILMLFGIGIAIATGIWMARMVRRRMILRARAHEQIEVGETGLRWQLGAQTMEIAWPDIAELERDEQDWFGSIVLRVESAEGVITFSALLPRAGALVQLLRERSGLDWQESPRIWRRWRGVVREGEVLVVRENTASAHLCAWMWAGIWATLPAIMLSNSLFDAQWSWAGWWPGVLLFVGPPLGCLGWLAAAIWVSAWRRVTRCDEVGLIHRGWLAPQSLRWDEIEEVGTRSELYDWLRARDGRIIKLSLLPTPGVSKGRQVLRAEINRRAPHARGHWIGE